MPLYKCLLTEAKVFTDADKLSSNGYASPHSVPAPDATSPSADNALASSICSACSNSSRHLANSELPACVGSCPAHLEGFIAKGVNAQGGLIPPYSSKPVLLSFMHLAPQEAHGCCVAELAPKFCISCILLHSSKLLPCCTLGHSAAYGGSDLYDTHPLKCLTILRLLILMR